MYAFKGPKSVSINLTCTGLIYTGRYIPIDGGCSPVAGQEGGVIDDGLVLGEVDDVHGDELRTEREDVELRPHRLILLQHFWDGHFLHLPSFVLKHRDVVLGCCQS